LKLHESLATDRPCVGAPVCTLERFRTLVHTITATVTDRPGPAYRERLEQARRKTAPRPDTAVTGGES
jgi:hypothetical protein